jgi:DNA-binding CsgD family transcriptional regulator
MELHSLADTRPKSDPLRSEIGRLIEVVGTPKFEPEMFQVARKAVSCEHLTAFAFSGDLPPRPLIAANAGSRPVARAIATKYVSHYWRMDPANDLLKFENKDADIALRILPDDIADGSYRHDCYTSVRLQDRFTVMRRRGAEVFRMNFYGAARAGRSGGLDIDRIMSSADLLICLLMKHDATSRSDKLVPELYRNRLRLLEPKMPARETEVCAAIIQGMTSEAIALKLGISVNTVLTYRKRAYTRLGISCQNELLRFVLS